MKNINTSKLKIIITNITILSIFMFLFFSIIIGLSLLSDYYETASNERSAIIDEILAEAIEEVVEIGYMDDEITARIRHQINESIGTSVYIEGTKAKKEIGENVYIRVQSGKKSHYVSKKVD